MYWLFLYVLLGPLYMTKTNKQKGRITRISTVVHLKTAVIIIQQGIILNYTEF